MIRFNHNGIKFELNYPNWLRQLLMRWSGLCAKEHSTYPGYYCVHKRGHDSICGCA